MCQRVDAYGFYQSGSGIKAWYFNHRGKWGGKQPPKKEWLREKDWTVNKWSYVGMSGDVDAGEPWTLDPNTLGGQQVAVRRDVGGRGRR